jgi:hypothetical protein
VPTGKAAYLEGIDTLNSSNLNVSLSACRVLLLPVPPRAAAGIEILHHIGRKAADCQ